MPTKRYLIRRMVPSMFHRRLLLLAVAAVGVMGVLATQMARLTIVQGSLWRHKAEAVLVHRRLIPTARGKILDRRMRVLAVDKPSYDVCVRYPVITGDWAYRQARRLAYRAHKQEWPQFDEHERNRLTTGYQKRFDTQVHELWRVLCDVGQIDRAELQRRKETVIRRVQQVASVVWDRRLQRRLEQEEEWVSLVDVSDPIGEQVAAHPLLLGLGRSALIRVRSLLAQASGDPEMAVWGQVSVEASKERQYPLETLTVVLDRSSLPTPLREPVAVETSVQGVGLHIIGTMRDVWKEDVQRRPYREIDRDGDAVIDMGGYLPGDHTGSWGIEKSQEDQLRGVRGQTIKRLDLDREQRQEPVSGGDVVLTLDIQLQARIQAIMDPGFGLMKVQPWHAAKPPSDPLEVQLGQPLNGAAVVLDVAHSHVLAAVSVPGFSRRQLAQDPASVWNDDVNQPFLNRPISRSYQPGSIVKPLVLAASVTDRKIGYREEVVCAGHLHPDFNDRYRCWIYKHYQSTHGSLAGPEAIARSCNIFFYTMGRRLGAARLVQWYSQMGLGSVTGCGLADEAKGDLPDLRLSADPHAAGFGVVDAIFMAIGQGPVRWTPLQAASSYAALARGGYVISPTLLTAGHHPDPRHTTDLELDPNAVEMVMQGLELAVTRSYGTAHGLAMLDHEPVFNIDGVRLYAKSGTAQGVPQWADQDGDGRWTKGVDRMVRRGDHAWVTCMV